MGLFGRKHQDEPENVAAGGADGAFEVVDAAGNRVRYTPADFDEIFTTSEAREMHRHVEIGWLLLDEWVGRDPGRSASWIDTGLRRSAGRVLLGLQGGSGVGARAEGSSGRSLARGRGHHVARLEVDAGARRHLAAPATRGCRMCRRRRGTHRWRPGHAGPRTHDVASDRARAHHELGRRRGLPVQPQPDIPRDAARPRRLGGGPGQPARACPLGESSRLWISRFQIRPEERVLSALLGQEYRDYAGRVRRWV